MATRGISYPEWQTLTPEQQYERFCELEAEYHALIEGAAAKHDRFVEYRQTRRPDVA